MRLDSEAAVVRTLEAGTHRLEDIYARVEDRADTRRAGGHDPIPTHPGDCRWKRRVRGALQDERRRGRAHRISRHTWVIDGPLHRPARLLLVVAGSTPLEFEIRLQSAIDLLGSLDSPADLVLCDPPWALGRDNPDECTAYGRDSRKVLPGYVDIDPDHYPQFTRDWITAAVVALRPGGQLVVVTGPQRAGIVQVTAEQAGLTWVSSIAAVKDFPVRTTRKPAAAHWVITVMCNGPVDHPGRVYHPPLDQPRARSGDLYPLDVWYRNGRADRRGDLIRYDNALPERMTGRIVHCFSDPDSHVVDPMLGSGTTAVECWKRQRRFTGADVNPWAVKFAAARLLAEHCWPADQQPMLGYPAPIVRDSPQGGGRAPSIIQGLW